MTISSLHIICGNCGRNDMFEHELIEDFNDHGEYFTDEVVITCKNCATNHSLSDYSNAKVPKVSLTTETKENPWQAFFDSGINPKPQKVSEK